MAQMDGFVPEERFAEWLRKLRIGAGQPSFQVLSRLTGGVRRGRLVPKSTVHKAFTGTSLPSLDDALSIAQACVLHGKGDQARLAAVRSECRQQWEMAKSARNYAGINRRPAERAAAVPAPPATDAADSEAYRRSPAEHEFLTKYKEFVAADLDTMELFGVTLRRPEFRYPMSTSYISLSVERGRRGATEFVADGRLTPRHVDRGPARETAGDDSSQAQDTLRVEQAINRVPRALIRGDAGTGKTTLEKWLAVGAARKDLPEPFGPEWTDTTPFFLPLRHFAERELPSSPEEFLAFTAGVLADAAPDGLVRKELEAGRALMLIDGADELPAARRGDVRSWLREWTSLYPDCRYVITSRQAAVDESWLADLGFRSFELAPMSQQDQNQFIAYWHSTMRSTTRDPEEIKRLHLYEDALLRSLAERRELRRLAGNPLMCALLCALHWDRDMQLPDGRLKLFEAALEMLLVRRDQQRNVVTQGPRLLSGVQEMLLRRLAYWMLRNDLTEVSFRQFADRVGAYLDEIAPQTAREAALGSGPQRYDAEQVADQLLERTGLLKRPAVDRVSFVHRTFQEYLAAAQLLNDGDLTFLVRQAHEDQWQDVVVMVAGRARDSEGNRLVRSLLKRADKEEAHRLRLTVLAVDCVSSAASAGVSLDRGLRREVGRRAERLIPPQDHHHAAALASLGEVVLDLLPGPRTGLEPHETQAVLHTARLVGGASAIRVLAGYAECADPATEHQLTDMWPEFDRTEFARCVLSKLPWAGPLSIGRFGSEPHLLEHVDKIAGLGELRVTGRAADYAVIGRLTALRSLHLLHPGPGLPGLELPPKLHTLVIKGPVRHDALLVLGVREFQELSFYERGCPDCGRTAWQLIARWPDRARLQVRRLSLYAGLADIDPGELTDRFPRLETFTLHVRGRHTDTDLARWRAGLRTSGPAIDLELPKFWR
ncbi:NACHT domain-containing protein [Actinacidiphila alni]|uniref:NACHT domain-containing protein n=1 Tax=Actinacidiphila alni TaxID=380248 RepID=UPI0034570388